MLHTIKKRLYFVVAAYFAFWAKFVLRRWKPRIVVITGSSGKTTALHLVEAQIGDKAVYSHHANSAEGLPLHILGMIPNVPSRFGWVTYFIRAPFHVFRRLPKAKLYIVEADCDRPHEGAFSSKLLKPEVTLWISISRTHSMNFDPLVQKGTFKTHEDAIAYEFGNFIAATTKLVLLNADQADMMAQSKRAQQGVAVKSFSTQAITAHQLTKTETRFTINQNNITLPGLHPKEVGVSLQMVQELLTYLQLPLDPQYRQLQMPPGRTNILAGQRGTVLIDSTYNTSLGATKAVLQLFDTYPSDQKWLVLGDLLEQGSLEPEEHKRLAELVQQATLNHVVLLGRRTKAYTFPLLQTSLKVPVVSFENPKEVLDYLQANLKGNEAILFKGAQGLEGVVEQLLANPADANQLVRREAVWVKRRQAWGLPK